MTFDEFTELSLEQNDSALFFKDHPLPVIIDEVQHAHNSFLQIKLLADNSKEKRQIIFTGSQSFKLLSKADNSMEWEPFYFSYANIADCEIVEKLREVVKGQYLRMQGIYRKKRF